MLVFADIFETISEIVVVCLADNCISWPIPATRRRIGSALAVLVIFGEVQVGTQDVRVLRSSSILGGFRRGEEVEQLQLPRCYHIHVNAMYTRHVCCTL